MTRRRPWHHAEALDVEARGEGRHHLDRAAGEPEGDWPDRRTARPVEDLLGSGDDDPPARHVVDRIGNRRQGLRRLVSLRSRLAVLLPLLQVLDVTPDRRRDLGDRGFYFHSRIPSRYA